MILFGAEPTTWEAVVEIMSTPTFRARLKLISKKTVDKAMCDELEKYVKQSSFNPIEV
jgi:hypothetical protein